jgi:hypothetical protein
VLVMTAGLEQERKQLSPEKGGMRSFPADGLVPNLCQWVDSSSLLMWIEAEVERFIPFSRYLPPVESDHAERLRKMLHLLCLAYCTGRAASVEIIEACRREPEFRMVTRNVVPFPDELKTFRRRYRALLEELLTRLFLRAAVSRSGFPEGDTNLSLETYVARQAKNVLDLARHLDSCDE